MNSSFAKRFNELNQQFELIKWTSPADDAWSTTDVWRQWGTSTEHLIQAVFDNHGPHATNFSARSQQCSGCRIELMAMKAVFDSAKADFEGGYVFNVDLRVSGEVFGDFIVLAKQALSEGHKDVAAVLACAALEDALKRFAAAKGITDLAGKDMSHVVNALKSKGHIAGAQKSMFDVMPKIRNYALHANWDKISEPDVNSVIGFVEQFLLQNFSA